MVKDSLGDRMKEQYEDRTRIFLPRRTFTIIRVDGKSFHTFTRNCAKPYDEELNFAMDAVAVDLCREIQGAAFAYVQSDEVSVLVSDFITIKTDAWFNGNLQKIVSVSASVATAAFNSAWVGSDELALFDARAFTIPDPVEVENYFIWRQQDAVRNSIQGLGQSCFSQKELSGKSCDQIQEMLFTQCGINWNDIPVDQKRGRVADKIESEGWKMDYAIPSFTAERNYLQYMIPTRTD